MGQPSRTCYNTVARFIPVDLRPLHPLTAPPAFGVRVTAYARSMSNGGHDPRAPRGWSSGLRREIRPLSVAIAISLACLIGLAILGLGHRPVTILSDHSGQLQRMEPTPWGIGHTRAPY